MALALALEMDRAIAMDLALVMMRRKKMNKVCLIGRLVADPEIRCTQAENQTAIARYKLAVDRRKNREGDQGTDFIQCVTFGKSAEFAELYLRKGMKIAISGRIQTGSYRNNEGRTVYTTDVVVDEHYFCEANRSAKKSEDGFVKIPDEIDEELPFV